MKFLEIMPRITILASSWMERKFQVTTVLVFCLLLISPQLLAQNIHVATSGSDENTGTESAPFLTISKAASVVKPGETVVIHEGTYREYIDPSVSGTAANRITFKAADGEEVFVKGSEVINSWTEQGDNTWKVTLSDEFFNGYNPYTLNVDGDFQNYGQWHHRGDVYLDNNVLNELQTLAQTKEEPFTWYTDYGPQGTNIYANFGDENPNEVLTEINVRELIFFPTELNIDYITLNGIRFLHAALNWQAPNVGSSDPDPLTQKGAIGSKMGRGWVIENCEVMYSKTAGIMMGETFDDLASFENINAFGDHVIRNNIIHKCGQYGIAGQKGMTRSTIIGNRIEDINFRNEFGGYEPAGIKIWNCVDVLIENNFIRNVIATQNNDSQSYCIWIDYANQGTRITRNILIGHPQTTTTLFLEANLGPTLVDNNIFIEANNKRVFVFSAGSVFAHNLFINTGFLYQIQEFDNGGSGARLSYSFRPHTLRQTNVGTPVEIAYNQMYNNIFARGAGPIDFGSQSGPGNRVSNNIYMGGTSVGSTHTNATVSGFNFSHAVTETDTGISLSFEFDDSHLGVSSPLVDADLVGQIPFSGQSIADESGHPITVDRDFNEVARPSNPTIGPLQDLAEGTNAVSIGTTVLPGPAIVYERPTVIPRQELVTGQKPYDGTAIDLPGMIEAENFDQGGPDVSYVDDNEKEGFTAIRPETNVDFGAAGEGVSVAWFESGEWLEYTINIQGGLYDIEVVAASGQFAPGELLFFLDEEEIARVDISGTDRWDNFKSFIKQGIGIDDHLNSVLRVTSTGGFNLDRISFVKTGVLQAADELEFSVYPNPVKDTLHITTYGQQVMTVEIVTLNGVVLLTATTDQIDTSSLASGTYLLKVNDEFLTKIIKK